MPELVKNHLYLAEGNVPTFMACMRCLEELVVSLKQPSECRHDRTAQCAQSGQSLYSKAPVQQSAQAHL